MKFKNIIVFVVALSNVSVSVKAIVSLATLLLNLQTLVKLKKLD